jgi:alkylresorcinol/alkylpyrone synthase
MRDVPDHLTATKPLQKPALDVGLLSLVSAVPSHVVTQDDVVQGTKEVFGEHFRDFDRIAAMFAATGIEQRYLTRPFDWYFGTNGWPERTAAYIEGADSLFLDAAGRALEAAGVSAQEIDTIVTVSSTGIATPSLEARAMGELGFRGDVRRVPVFGLGCAGGVAGLATAAELAAARPGSVVLMVTIELCSLAVRRDTPTMANMVALALFADGAAAAVLTSGEGGIARVLDSGHHTWPGTLDIMGWKVDPVGFGVIFDQSIPVFARGNLRAAVDEILHVQGFRRGDIDRYICHPGGRKVVEALEGALELERGSLDIERDVLRRYANMSAPTALFVLEETLRSGLPDRSVLMALGPGFTVSTATLGRVPS